LQPFSFSSIHFLAKLPSRISARSFLHFVARLLGDDARAGCVVAVFGGITDGVAHVAEAAAVDEVDDEFQFVQAFEIGDFRLIAGFSECFESGFDQGADTAAEHGLFAEKVGFGFFGERGFENSGAGAANATRVRERKSFSVAAGVLLDREEARSTAAFGEDFRARDGRVLWERPSIRRWWWAA